MDRQNEPAGVGFWIKRFVTVLLLAFVVIGLGQLARGRGLEHALTEAAIWSPITAAVYLAAVWYHWRKGRYCRACAVPGTPASERQRQVQPPSPQ